MAEVTFADTVHDPLDGTEPDESPSVMPPGTAKGVPPQVVATLGGEAITMPAGSVSENASTVKDWAFGLLTKIVNTDGVLAAMVVGKNDFDATGGVSGVLVADTLMGEAGPAPSGSILAVFVMMAGGLGFTRT